MTGRRDLYTRQQTINGASLVNVRSGGGGFTPTNYSGLLDVKTEAGHVDYVDALATGATKIHLSCTAEAGTAGSTTALWVAFAATAAEAVAIVNATAGSEAGIILTNNIVAGWIIDEPLGIPSAFRGGGYIAFAILGADGTNYSTLNIVQGVQAD